MDNEWVIYNRADLKSQHREEEWDRRYEGRSIIYIIYSTGQFNTGLSQKRDECFLIKPARRRKRNLKSPIYGTIATAYEDLREESSDYLDCLLRDIVRRGHEREYYIRLVKCANKFLLNKTKKSNYNH